MGGRDRRFAKKLVPANLVETRETLLQQGRGLEQIRKSCPLTSIHVSWHARIEAHIYHSHTHTHPHN